MYQSIQFSVCINTKYVMKYRLNKEGLLANISMWNGFLRRKVHLIACGGTGVDFEDCLGLVKSKSEDINLEVLKKRFLETSSYEIAQERVNRNLDSFLRLVIKEGLYGR